MAAIPILAAVLVLAVQVDDGPTRADSIAGRTLAEHSLRTYRDSVHLRATATLHVDFWHRHVWRNMSRLISNLDRAATLSPRDQWIMAMRVTWKASFGNYDGAEEVIANSCGEPLWWCSALAGYVRRYDIRLPEAKTAFDSVLVQMSPEQRCLWTDLSLVLTDPELISRYRSLPCEEREALNRKIWWLADPLWHDDINDRELEHYTRWVTAELLRLESQALGWARFRTEPGNESLEYLLRGGVLRWCRVAEENRSWLTNSRICPFRSPTMRVGNDPHARLDRERLFHMGFPGGWSHGFVGFYTMRFLPRGDALDRAFRASAVDSVLAPLRLSSDRMVVPGVGGGAIAWGPMGDEHYPHFGWLHTITDPQVGAVLRDGKSHVVVTWDPRTGVSIAPLSIGGITNPNEHFRLDLLKQGSRRIAVILSPGPDSLETTITGHWPRDEQPVRLTMVTSLDSAVVSLEMLSNEYPVGARHRSGFRRPSLGSTSRVKASDIFLYDPAGDLLARSFDQLDTVLLPRSALERGEHVGLFWELYGLRAGETPGFELMVEHQSGEGSTWTRMRESLGMRAQSGSVATRWTDAEISATGIGAHAETGHSLILDTSNFPPGIHRLTLTGQIDGQAVAGATKYIRIR